LTDGTRWRRANGAQPDYVGVLFTGRVNDRKLTEKQTPARTPHLPSLRAIGLRRIDSKRGRALPAILAEGRHASRSHR
jgi:hypothetical protein